ncbi:SICA antigen [Plasmodium coatneyi]|uniref:SICA antigen n=1 Tax=Plasmodium coatneyi TaxID=208452 RepID=A0A1B1DWS7_9APIC|nr:SICA antigen [Plasmodium coatneyi]ANQ07246.1 SICA antigen [Plasmodium coatneyi]
MENILQDGGNDKGHCSALAQDNSREKELCKILLRIFYWMDGLERKPEVVQGQQHVNYEWKIREVNGVKEQSKEELQRYYRCMLGHVIIVGMLGGHCFLDKVAEKVKNGRQSTRDSKGIVGQGNTLCDTVDLQSLNLGKKFMWGEVGQWVNDYENREGGLKLLNEVKRGNNSLHRRRDEGQESKHCPAGWIKGQVNQKTLKDLGIQVTPGEEDLNLEKDNKTLGKEALETVVKRGHQAMKTAEAARKDDVQGDANVEEQTKQAMVQAIKDVLPPPPQTVQPAPPAIASNPKTENNQCGNVQNHMNTMLGDLGDYLKAEKDRIKDKCSKVQVEGQNSPNAKKFCKTLLKVAYWTNSMGSWKELREKEKEPERGLRDYLRCVMGNSIMIKILGNKCKIDNIKEILSKEAEGKKEVSDFEKMLNGCAKPKCENMEVSMEEIKQKAEIFVGGMTTGGMPEGNKIMDWFKCSKPKPSKPDNKATEATAVPTGSPEPEGDKNDKGSSSQIPAEQKNAGESSPKGSSREASSNPPGITWAGTPSVRDDKLNDQKDPEHEGVGSGEAAGLVPGAGGAYFAFLGKRGKRYRRSYQVRGPQSLGEQLLGHMDDQADGPLEYTLVKERKPRSTPIKRRKKPSCHRRLGRRGVRRRMIIDIHFEVLEECQKGDTKLVQEDYFEILVQEFMGSKFIKEENVPKEGFLKEQVPSSNSGFRAEDIFPKEQVPSSGLDSRFREEDFVPKEEDV